MSKTHPDPLESPLKRYQANILKWLNKIPADRLIMELPTGFGKSAVPSHLHPGADKSAVPSHLQGRRYYAVPPARNDPAELEVFKKFFHDPATLRIAWYKEFSLYRKAEIKRLREELKNMGFLTEYNVYDDKQELNYLRNAVKAAQNET